MKKLLLATSIVLLLVGCNDQAPKEQSLNDQAQKVSETEGVAVEQTQSVAPDTQKIPNWVSENKVTAPLDNIVDGDKTYKAVSYCKPHNCAGDFMISLTGKDNKEYSMVVHVKDTNGAITKPSEYASYQFIGNPDDNMKGLLHQALLQNPNWK